MSGFREYFISQFDCETWDICQTGGYHCGLVGSAARVWSLLDHGFIVDAAPLYAKLADPGSDLNGHEIAIVSRTYCTDDDIDNPPDGLKCVRLPDHFLGGDAESSTVIMTVITGNTPAALAFLNCCGALPANLLSVTLSREMIDSGYRVCLNPINRGNFGFMFSIVDATDANLPDRRV